MNTIIEKIKAEIERHKELFKEACDCGSYYACARRDEANEILEVLSDLEKEEKPTPEEGGAEHASGSSEIPNDLDEAAKKYAVDNTWIDEFTNDGEVPEWYEHTADVFKAGASWQKEQMMKGAIDAEFCSAGMFMPMIDFKDKRMEGSKYGDTIKVIVIKEK